MEYVEYLYISKECHKPHLIMYIWRSSCRSYCSNYKVVQEIFQKKVGFQNFAIQYNLTKCNSERTEGKCWVKHWMFPKWLQSIRINRGILRIHESTSAWNVQKYWIQKRYIRVLGWLLVAMRMQRKQYTTPMIKGKKQKPTVKATAQNACQKWIMKIASYIHGNFTEPFW